MTRAVLAILALAACKPAHKPTAHLVNGEIVNRPLRPPAKPLIATKLAIGVKTLEEFCGTGSADDRASCETIAEKDKPDVKLLAVHGEGGAVAAPCYIALRGASGWAIDSLDTECLEGGKYSRVVKKPTIDMVGDRLVVHWAVESHDPMDKDDNTTITQTELATYLVVCTTPAGDPRCTKTIQTSDHVIADGQPPAEWELSATWLDDGKLELAPMGAPGTLPAEASALVGAHTIVSE